MSSLPATLTAENVINMEVPKTPLSFKVLSFSRLNLSILLCWVAALIIDLTRVIMSSPSMCPSLKGFPEPRSLMPRPNTLPQRTLLPNLAKVSAILLFRGSGQNLMQPEILGPNWSVAKADGLFSSWVCWSYVCIVIDRAVSLSNSKKLASSVLVIFYLPRTSQACKGGVSMTGATIAATQGHKGSGPGLTNPFYSRMVSIVGSLSPRSSPVYKHNRLEP